MTVVSCGVHTCKCRCSFFSDSGMFSSYKKKRQRGKKVWVVLVQDLDVQLIVLNQISLEQSRCCQSKKTIHIFGSIQSLSCVRLFVTPWTAAHQAPLSITNSRSLLKLMSIESLMPSNYLILCHPLLLSPSTFPSIGVFSNESVLCIRWPKYWRFSFSISPSS